MRIKFYRCPEIEKKAVLQMFNLAVPANEFVNLAERGNEGNIADYEQIQQNGPQRDALHVRYDFSAIHIAVAVEDGQN